MLFSVRCLDRGIEREQPRLPSDSANGACEITNAVGEHAQLLDLSPRRTHMSLNALEKLTSLRDVLPALSRLLHEDIRIVTKVLR